MDLSKWKKGAIVTPAPGEEGIVLEQGGMYEITSSPSLIKPEYDPSKLDSYMVGVTCKDKVSRYLHITRLQLAKEAYWEIPPAEAYWEIPPAVDMNKLLEKL